jgi:YfiH family protein
LSNVGGVDAEGAEQARERLRAATGVAELVRGYQVHGSHVNVVERAGEAAGVAELEADGQATGLRGVGVMVLVADCLPIALARPGGVAMLHAGWRGLAGGVLEQGVRALARLTGSPEGMIALIGPAAGPCCYEVGPEVRAALGRRGSVGAAGFGDAEGSAGVRDGAGRARIDLRGIARERLLVAGVVEVRDVQACTICDERLFSHRREGARAGRQAGVAWLS